MPKGLVIRVDDCLIHGQILYGWAAGWPADEIWLADDRVAADAEETALYTEQLAGHVRGGVIGIDIAIKRYSFELGQNENVLLIVAGLTELTRLLEGGVQAKEIHIGNLSGGEDGLRISKTVSLSTEQRDQLRHFLAQGRQITIRPLPSSSPILLNEDSWERSTD